MKIMFNFFKKWKESEFGFVANKYDSYMFVKRVIESSETIPQLLNAENLINFHYSLYGDYIMRSELNSLSSNIFDCILKSELDKDVIEN